MNFFSNSFQHERSNFYDKLTLTLILVLIGLANFLLFSPGKEVIGIILLVISLALFGYNRFKSTKSIYLSKENYLLIVIAAPLIIHIIYGAINMLNGAIEFGTQGLFENNHLRSFIKIGVKQYSLICGISLALFFNLYLYSKKEHLLYKITIFSIITVIGIINSLNGLAITLIVTLFYIIIFNILKKENLKKGFKKLLILSFISFTLAFIYSGGAKRLININENIKIINNNFNTDTWKYEDGFTKKFKENTDNYTYLKIADESYYLRASWYRFGLSFIINNPLGIGYSSHPLKSALYYENPQVNEQLLVNDFHSRVLDIGICYGVPGLFIVAIFFIYLYKNLYKYMFTKSLSSTCLFYAVQISFWWELFFESVGLGMFTAMIIISCLIFSSCILNNLLMRKL